MSRPEFPHCILTSEIIRAIREDQRLYDEDPDRYERNENDEDLKRDMEHWGY